MKRHRLSFKRQKTEYGNSKVRLWIGQQLPFLVGGKNWKLKVRIVQKITSS